MTVGMSAGEQPAVKTDQYHDLKSACSVRGQGQGLGGQHCRTELALEMLQR